MVRLVIRDDDANFFTKPEDIINIYKSIPNFPISYAVVPHVTDVIGGCPDTKGNTTPMFVGDNKELVSLLKEMAQTNKCDILLHGITHGYKFKSNGQKIPEMIWRESQNDLGDLIGSCKCELESLFNYKIKCFVAPSNHIAKNGIQGVYNNGMNFSGIINLNFQRDISYQSVCNYMKRFFVRATKGVPFPGVLNYGTHLELNANNHLGFEYLKKLYSYCDANDFPLAINVHYWHIRDNKQNYLEFFKFIKYAMDNGAIPTKLSDCFVK